MIRMLVAALAVLLPWAAFAEEQPYLLNSGDVLQISVWKEEGLDREILVLPDGTINFPLAGSMVAAGRTTEELKGEIGDRLQRFIPDALVTVTVLSTAGNKIYVVGEVNRPGEYQIVRSVSVLQALSLAGGLTPFAGENRIRVLRREGDAQVVYPFRYGDVQAGESLETNIELKSGDVVMVPGTSLF